MIQLIPLNGGINGQIDKRLLPDGVLADAVNVELDRQGRLVGRAKYTAQAVTVGNGLGNLVAYDLFRLNNRLFAFGDQHSYGFPSDIFERLPDGLGARWRPTSNVNSGSPRLPRATKVREIARPPDQAGGISNMGCAATSGYAALVWNSSDDTTLGFVNLVAAADNQPIIFAKMVGATMPQALLRVVALSDRFIFLGVTSGALISADFTLLTDGVIQALVSIVTGTIVTYAACKVAGVDQFIVAYNIGGTVTIRRYNTAGAQQGSDITIVQNATRIAIEASNTANQLVVLLNVAGTVTAYGYTLSTGVAIGNAAAFSGETCVEVGLCRVSATVVQAVVSVTSETAPTVMANLYTVASNTFAGVTNAVTDAQLAASPVFATETFFGIRSGADGLGGTPNMLVSSASSLGSFSATDDERVTPQICKDLETAGTASALMPDIALDSSTGKYYWCNATANPDNDFTPVITEFELNSTDRRMVVQFGNLAYIAGGCPLVFDGQTVCEQGFLLRPRIISLTPSNGAGELIGGGEYDYRQHEEWIDSDQNLHLGPVSKISTTTLGATHDTVAAVTTSAISMRRNGSASDRGAVVRNVLSRTLGSVARVAAVLTGRATLDPPSTSLSGRTFQALHYNSETAVVTVETVTFSAGATTSAQVVIEVNAAFNLITATAPGGTLVLTADTPGSHISIYADIATAAVGAILGFLTFEGDVGETTHTKGENFQRAASAFTATGDAVATYVTVTDLRKDESDPIVDTDLIRQQPLYSQGIAAGSHHAPPPAEFIAAGKERMGYFGQPRRARYTFSKPAAPSEPIECAAEGFINFSGQCTGGDIEAGWILGDTTLLWTRRDIWQVTGSGPGRNGVGEFFAARQVSKAGGLVRDGWKSLCETEKGVMFQRASDQLCLLGTNGSVEWVGANVQDYLVLYPVITASVYVSSKHTVAFAVRNSGSSGGGILRLDLESNAWFFDDVGVCVALSEFEGRLSYVQGGVVYIQDTAPGSGTFVPYHVDLGMNQSFQTLGWGQLNEVGFLGTYRGECTVNVYLSPNGEDFTLHATWGLTDAEYDPGDRVQLLKAPALQMRDSWSVRLEVTHSSTNSEGVWLHAIAFDLDPSPEMVRKGAAHRS